MVLVRTIMVLVRTIPTMTSVARPYLRGDLGKTGTVPVFPVRAQHFMRGPCFQLTCSKARGAYLLAGNAHQKNAKL